MDSRGTSEARGGYPNFHCTKLWHSVDGIAMFVPLLSSTVVVVLLLAMAWAPPVAMREAGAVAQTKTIADEIADPVERTRFLRVWDTTDPTAQRDLAASFVAEYPRSILLREAYEIAARASLKAGDAAGALDWGRRAFRSFPKTSRCWRWWLTLPPSSANRRWQNGALVPQYGCSRRPWRRRRSLQTSGRRSVARCSPPRMPSSGGRRSSGATMPAPNGRC